MKTTSKIVLASILMLVFNSCSKQVNNEVAAELQIHFDNFVAEANNYGMIVSLEGIDIGGYVENIENIGTLGQCKSFSDDSKQIVIDHQFWSGANAIEREYVVFHELGHCILGREHKDEKDANGHCMSIMQSGNSDCSGIYNLQNRNSLLLELFEF